MVVLYAHGKCFKNRGVEEVMREYILLTQLAPIFSTPLGVIHHDHLNYSTIITPKYKLLDHRRQLDPGQAQRLFCLLSKVVNKLHSEFSVAHMQLHYGHIGFDEKLRQVVLLDSDCVRPIGSHVIRNNKMCTQYTKPSAFMDPPPIVDASFDLYALAATVFFLMRQEHAIFGKADPRFLTALSLKKEAPRQYMQSMARIWELEVDNPILMGLAQCC